MIGGFFNNAYQAVSIYISHKHIDIIGCEIVEDSNITRINVMDIISNSYYDSGADVLRETLIKSFRLFQLREKLAFASIVAHNPFVKKILPGFLGYLYKNLIGMRDERQHFFFRHWERL